jgi:hypothetical protein
MAVKQVFNTSAELDFPNVLPTLDLDFANSKTLDPRITFTRASGGSYVGADGLIKYAGVNEARFDHDPSSGESLGLLVEEARTNRTTSSDYSTVTLSNVSKSTTVSTTAPDGSTVFAFDANNNTSVVHRITLTNGSTGNATVPHTASFFIKIPPIGSSGQISNNDRLLFLVRWRSSSGSGTGAVFDYFQSTQNFRILSVVGAFGPNPPATYNISANSPYYEKWPNGWYRFVFPGAVASNTSADSFALYDWNISETNVEQGGNCSVFLWGAQFEQGASPTSYIPTQGSTRTRAADNASITGKNFSEWYRQIGYTIFSEHITARPSSVFPRVFNISTSTDSFRLNHYQPPQANYVGFSAINNDINFADIRYFNITQSVKAKMATSYDFNNVVLYVNGDFVGRDITNPYPSQNRDRINIGSATPSGSYINSTISKITYYPYPLKDSNLQSLTS